MIDARPAGSLLRYAWPTPTGILLILAAYGVAHFLGMRAFLNTHVWFEIGITVSMLASVVYAIRLSGKGRGLAPRWVFVLNLCFGPFIFGFMILSGLISALTDTAQILLICLAGGLSVLVSTPA